ncbi:hypothetical protein B0H17DRAFT_1140183 [Mycena rosella]|uniref:Uncharacterized protein n=1 Tax=Mycena rosella TaxID=1033263 RepID=A0AAD7D317_MYCRO|nr:hypothetical protein B0H17DRAFT_1140183 [Mycena rosella]
MIFASSQRQTHWVEITRFPLRIDGTLCRQFKPFSATDPLLHHWNPTLSLKQWNGALWKAKNIVIPAVSTAFAHVSAAVAAQMCQKELLPSFLFERLQKRLTADYPLEISHNLVATLAVTSPLQALDTVDIADTYSSFSAWNAGGLVWERMDKALGRASRA